VQKGRQQGSELGKDYMEVRFEQLISNPQSVLTGVGAFVGQPLDYQKIQAAGIGSVAKPNTSFAGSTENFNPVARYKNPAHGAEVAHIEELTADLLDELGYPVGGGTRKPSSRLIKRELYDHYFTLLRGLRSKTPLGRMTDLRTLDIW
jgi:hypothetical protein